MSLIRITKDGQVKNAAKNEITYHTNTWLSLGTLFYDSLLLVWHLHSDQFCFGWETLIRIYAVEMAIEDPQSLSLIFGGGETSTIFQVPWSTSRCLGEHTAGHNRRLWSSSTLLGPSTTGATVATQTLQCSCPWPACHFHCHHVGGVRPTCMWLRGKLLPFLLLTIENRRKDACQQEKFHTTWNCNMTASCTKSHPFLPQKILNHTTGIHKLTSVKCAL